MKKTFPYLMVAAAVMSGAAALSVIGPREAQAQIAAEVLGNSTEDAAQDEDVADEAVADEAEAAVAAEGLNTAVAYDDGVRSYTSDDTPTFAIADDGTVDWPTFSGFRRYHAECHVCHGPDGEGSTYAPALRRSVLTMDYFDFVGVVAGGRQQGNSVMPAFGDNANVMCYIEDIYTYLLARGAGDLPRGRPAERAEKPEAYTEIERACMG